MTCQTTHRPNHCLRKNCQIVLHKVTQGLLNFASTFFLVWFNSNCLQISENIIAKYQYFAVLGSMTSTAIHKIMDNNLLFLGSGCVAQLVERLLPIPGVCGSNPVIGKNYHTANFPLSFFHRI